jgi:hypothetical protein
MVLRILDLEPNDVQALAVVTSAEHLERNPQAVAQAATLAEKGLRALANWKRPEGVSENDFKKMSAQMAQIFYSAAGAGALQSKDYVHAREYLSKSIQLDSSNFRELYALGTADLEMDPIDANGFWYIAKAINMAEDQNDEGRRITMEFYAKGKYTKYHGSEEGWDSIVSQAQNQSAPPADFAKSVKPGPPAH